MHPTLAAEWLATEVMLGSPDKTLLARSLVILAQHHIWVCYKLALLRSTCHIILLGVEDLEEAVN